MPSQGEGLLNYDSVIYYSLCLTIKEDSCGMPLGQNFFGVNESMECSGISPEHSFQL